MNSTATSFRRGWPSSVAALAAVPVLAMGLQIGTGGVATPLYLKQRGDMGYAYPMYRNTDAASSTSLTRTATQNIRLVREVFRAPVTALAGLFNVSRQAIYDWQAGRPISRENEAKLDDLAAAAHIIQVARITGSQALRRKIQGKTLFEIVNAGGNAEQAAETLILQLRRETAQRAQIESRLSGRRRPVDSDDLGVPRFVED